MHNSLLDGYLWLRLQVIILLRDIELALWNSGARWFASRMMKPRWWIYDHLLPYPRDYVWRITMEHMMNDRHQPGQPPKEV